MARLYTWVVGGNNGAASSLYTTIDYVIICTIPHSWFVHIIKASWFRLA